MNVLNPGDIVRIDGRFWYITNIECDDEGEALNQWWVGLWMSLYR
jgi:hypothetical protein